MASHAGGSYSEHISYVTDRPGHDQRFAINSAKINNELGWQLQESFHSGLRKIVEWAIEGQRAP
ncbi:GDP-mannose 4,6-dehydratase [Vreelandella venusta]